MNAAFEHRISSALMRWRFVERALHSQGEWAMSYNGIMAPAQRTITTGAISFVAEFPAMCPIEEPSLLVTIFEDGEPVHVVILDDPLDEEGSDIRYDVSLPDPVTA